MNAELVAGWKKNFPGPMTAEEVQFLRDVQGYIDFAIRNGLGFHFATSGLAHDINGVLRYGTDLNAARANGFRAKVSGYSALGPNEVGESEEAE